MGSRRAAGIYVYSADTGTSPDYGGQSGFFYVVLLHGVREQLIVLAGGRVTSGTTFRLNPVKLHPVGTAATGDRLLVGVVKRGVAYSAVVNI